MNPVLCSRHFEVAVSARTPAILLAALLLPACIDVSLTATDKDEGEDPVETGLDDLGDTADTAADTDDGCADAEVPYDGVDNDCDTATPDDDLDGDGALFADDCDDADPARSPLLAELCDGVDNDCDGVVDGTNAVDTARWYPDGDGDGFGDPTAWVDACDAPFGHLSDATDCDDAAVSVNPLGTEVCNGADDDCDGATDEDACTLGYGGHRIDKAGDYYYALYNDDGFGILGSTDWFGSSDASSTPEGVTWNEDQSLLYYNDLGGNVWVQAEPFDATSTRVGTFAVGQVGGGVVFDGVFYTGDYAGGNIYAMDLSTGRTGLYASLGGTACKPYFGNSAMSIDTDGRVYAASSCGIVVYEPGTDAVMLNSYSGLISAVAMDATQNLYGLDYYGNIVEFDKTTGAELGHVTISPTPSVTWTLAVDGNGDFVVNYWGEQYIFSGVDGSVVERFDASAYYPGSSGYYWYVTF